MLTKFKGADMKRFYLLLVLASIFTIGCGGISKQLETNDPGSTSLVYGHIDMGKAPCELGWLDLKQVLPVTDKPYWHVRIDKGAFYDETIRPGSYQMSGLGGAGKGFLIFSSNTVYTFNFPVQTEGFRVDQPGKLHYLGSWKITSKGDFFSSSYSIVPTASPTEKEILEIVLPRSKGTQWEGMIQRRIRKLTK